MVTLPSFLFFAAFLSLVQAVRFAYRRNWRVGLKYYLLVTAIVAVIAATFAARFARRAPTNRTLGMRGQRASTRLDGGPTHPAGDGLQAANKIRG